jgi:hypothetical protein
MDWDTDPVPDPAFHFDADPDAYLDPDFYLMQIWMWILILIFI